jgi:copper chaperone NosL
MVLSDVSSAAQIVAPGEEPRFFDDLRCLRDYLSANPLPKAALVYVVDHRTHAWVEAARATFASAPAIETPMGSHLLAYADENSMAADSHAAGTRVSVEEALGTRAAEAVRAGRMRKGEGKP